MSTPGKNAAAASQYVLRRDITAATRLNHQHYIFKETLGYLLHPSIPRKENMTVADIGTGTGIWLLDVAKELPAGAQLDGFDISLDQCPAKGWLPENMKFEEFNIFEEPARHLVGRYDVVHIRLVVIVIPNNDPRPALRNLVKLLKPGGYIQWDEIAANEPLSTALAKADPSLSISSYENLQNSLQDELKLTGWKSTWTEELGQIFEEQGLVDVKREEKKSDRMWCGVNGDNILMMFGELVTRVREERRAEFEELFERTVEEGRRGVSWNLKWFVTVGRKA